MSRTSWWLAFLAEIPKAVRWENLGAGKTSHVDNSVPGEREHDASRTELQWHVYKSPSVQIDQTSRGFCSIGGAANKHFFLYSSVDDFLSKDSNQLENSSGLKLIRQLSVAISGTLTALLTLTVK